MRETNKCSCRENYFFNAFSLVINVADSTFVDMGFITKLLRFYVASSLHVAVCFVALFAVIHFNYLDVIPWQMFMILFCGAVVGYNLVKYGDRIHKKHRVNYQPVIIAITAVCAFVSGYLLLDESGLAILIIGLASFISILYTLPFWKRRGLRSVPVFKLTSVAVAWSLVLVIYPQFSTFTLVLQRAPIGVSELVLKFLEIFILVIALCIPFEIRDLKYDPPALHTLPQLIGVSRSIFLGIGLTIAFLAIHLYNAMNFNDGHALVTFLITLILAVLIYYANKVKSDYYSSIIVEALPLYWLGLLWVESAS